MQNAKKICCRITPRRTLGAVLLGAIVVNLITVGAVYKATVPESAPTDTVTATQTTVILTETFAVLTATEENIPTLTLTPTDTATHTPTFTPTYTPTPTSTETATSTFTNTPSPSPTPCFPKYEWPVYVVQPGDWLLAIARTTGSSVQELSLANCLVDTRIYPGQGLRVPRLPVIPPIVTTAASTDTPTDFKISGILSCDPPWYVSLSVSVFDPQGVLTVMVRFFTKDDVFTGQLTMQPDGNTYFGSGSLQGQYTVYDFDHYIFYAMDSYQNVTVSHTYYDRANSCNPLPTETSTSILQ